MLRFSLVVTVKTNSNIRPDQIYVDGIMSALIIHQTKTTETNKKDERKCYETEMK